ncbi:Metallo-dependent hydrolase [Mycena sanguinolenta]|uniref:Metallo-dependent hydrolase n=1 Tax=Mycena sanguinolenta TaxID=230812 RepID=A0A8H6ZB73_9AGAR|nr:Metallo-dependent hydrolase [Mycena sanguinolenta]
MWQTQLKGRHANDLLLDYIFRGLLMGALFNPDDVFWGELGGCMESLDGGVTTIVDHAHINNSAEHSPSALLATVASGIRSYFCYSPVPWFTVASWAPFRLDTDAEPLPDWAMRQLADLAATQPFGNGRVRLGVAFDAYYLPKDVVVSLFENTRRLGVKLFTSHYVRNPLLGPHSVVNILDSYGLLKDDILLSHANQAFDEDAAQLVAKNAHVSATPDTELQMAHGTPVCFRPDLHKISSLGIDCHSNNSGDILSQMRLALQSARGTANQRFVDQWKLPQTVAATVEQAFNLGTIMGARAVGMGSEIGSIAVGKLADIVVFDAQSPAMICVAEEDPVAAIVMHASVRDIETVIVDGRIRKSGGKLAPAEAPEGPVEWPQVAAKLLQSRKRMQETMETADMVGAKKTIIERFHIDERVIVEHL